MCYKPHLVLELTLPWKELRLCLCHSSHSLTFIRKWTPVIRRQWPSSFYKFDGYNPISKQKIATILNISVTPNGPGKGSQYVMYCSLSQKILFIEIATKGKQDTLCELEQPTIKEKESKHRSDSNTARHLHGKPRVSICFREEETLIHFKLFHLQCTQCFDNFQQTSYHKWALKGHLK